MMPAGRRAKTIFQISAGGVIYRPAGDMTMVCLIKTPPHGDWQLPKGLVEKKESLEATAVREVREETGLEGCSEELIDTIDYWFWLEEAGEKKRCHKVVYFYLIKYAAGHTDNHDHEVEEARWLHADEALHRLSFASEKRVMQKALEIMKVRNSA